MQFDTAGTCVDIQRFQAALIDAKDTIDLGQ